VIAHHPEHSIHKGRSIVNRRDFTRLAAAALGGAIAGARLAAAEDKPKKKDVEKPLFTQEPHICRGLNTCKEKGKGGKNDCAGMGQCATAKAHTCSGDNDCAGQGGCGEHPGENKCKGMGQCGVPMSDKAWAKARKTYEAQLTKAGKKFGDAPKKEK
jgi:hypothetical protein